MGVRDYLLLALILGYSVYILFFRGKKGCCGDCSQCCGSCSQKKGR
ncbi:MAG: hypothetical protein LUJ09_04535 [Firmicutes bacterium]|nr:hypothetical protein [Bacillota bacterium]